MFTVNARLPGMQKDKLYGFVKSEDAVRFADRLYHLYNIRCTVGFEKSISLENTIITKKAG